jgi:hypothetical protein
MDRRNFLKKVAAVPIVAASVVKADVPSVQTVPESLSRATPEICQNEWFDVNKQMPPKIQRSYLVVYQDCYGKFIEIASYCDRGNGICWHRRASLSVIKGVVYWRPMPIMPE